MTMFDVMREHPDCHFSITPVFNNNTGEYSYRLDARSILYGCTEYISEEEARSAIVEDIFAKHFKCMAEKIRNADERGEADDRV